MQSNTRKLILIVFALLAALSVFYILQLKFSFYLEQFFPEGDEDLAFFQEFIEDFETDVNFMMVAVKNDEGVFEKDFLNDFHDFTLKSRDLPYIEQSQSLTKMYYPQKTPFGITTVPIIHRDKPKKYEKDKSKILKDPRFMNTLISADAKTMVVALKTEGAVLLDESAILIESLDSLMQTYAFDQHHYMGPAYFQKEMVRMQKREVIVSAIVSSILVCLIMFVLYRRPWGIGIALTSIGLGLLLFMGLLSLFGRELNAMAALYPVLMIIVGTSDVVHIMTKYIIELRKGFSKKDAIRTTIKEIGMATLLTSITTAVGFATLMTSRIIPIRDFGMNAAVGVIVAFVTVIFFTTALLSFFKTDQIIKLNEGPSFWAKFMERLYQFTLKKPKQIAIGGVAVFLLCLLGISMITTNYRIESNLPIGEKITEDFLFFEDNFAGFRPLEFAVFAQDDYDADSYEVMNEISKLEDHLANYPAIRNVNSITMLYKSINQMENYNKASAYKMPEDEKTFLKYKKMADKLPSMGANVLLSKDNKKTRVSSRVSDLGADSIRLVTQNIDSWIESNIDEKIISVRQTGTGLILDKNSQYVRSSLLNGLGLAVLIISVLMALLFRNWRMLFVSMIPNVFPLLLAGALLGYIGIELEAGISIVFAVVFGIAVDDTIHFLSKFKLSRQKGLSVEESLHVTFLETGEAICITSVILFFGFLVMLFSIHPPSITIGALISLTLVSALFSDVLLIPIMIRWLMKEEEI